MATQDKYQQAVKENRMVSVQEATIRKAVGFAIFGLTTLRLYTRVFAVKSRSLHASQPPATLSLILLHACMQGIAGMSGTALSFLYAVATTFLITGFYNQCGCSLR